MLRGQANLRFGLLLALLGLALVAAGCGGGSSSSSSSTSGSTSSSESGSGSEPSAQFLKKGNNTIPKFGEESSLEEREAANAVVVESLQARQAADFQTQCETLDLKAIKEIPDAKGHEDCAAKLKKLAEPLSSTKETRTDALSGSIAAFRVKGNRGFALFHGNDGKNYAVPLEKEGGGWKISMLRTPEL